MSDQHTFYLYDFNSLKLSRALMIIAEPDGDYFLAKCQEIIHLYGIGDTPDEAVEMFKREVESLYEYLMEDDNWPVDYLATKKFLSKLAENG